jgi:polyhydroxyalkanoate synthase
MAQAQIIDIRRKEAPAAPPRKNANLLAQSEKDFDPFGAIERGFHAWLGQMTAGVSPNAYSLAFRDWIEHLALSPGKQMELIQSAAEHLEQLQRYMADAMAEEPPACPITPDPTDRRFKAEEWCQFPYNVYQQSFLLYRDWWKQATSAVRGVNPHSLDLVSFTIRQMIDAFSPSNFVLTNPLLAKATQEQKGMNLITGWMNFLEDMSRLANDQKPVGLEQFEVGKNLGVTKGKVVFRNELLELIQYEPTTKNVYAEPIFIVPAWIMKYYILDLSEHNSLVKYLVDQGHTVFMISWKNPTAEYRNVGLNDYLQRGLFEALHAAQDIVPDKKFHAVGYCLGGTLLAMAAAWVGKRHKHPFASITLFTAQVDYEEPGELHMFIDESQLRFLEDIMQEQGYLDKHQMKGIFQWLRSNEQIWSNMISNYLMGERALHNDLMAWNADATRMPYKMHSQYLREMYLNNALAEGKY